MDAGKLTIRQIAKLAGVSRSTVSRVLNDHPNVSPQTRERVLQVVAETGFQPDPIARSLSSRRADLAKESPRLGKEVNNITREE
jgi:LacI family transcriptional regulator